MKIFQKIFALANFKPLLLVIIFAVLAGRSLIFEKGYFNMHDDLQMMRQLELEKCFLDGQFPCRWVPDMGYGYGFPLFNFYPPLPYLVGELFRIFQFSFVDTAKLTFALSFALSGLAMYYLAKEFFGRLGGVVSAVLYIWAPYHSVDVYVRGAMNEAWALVWFPLILLFAYKLIKEKETEKIRHWMLLLAFSWAGLLLSHNLMVMIFTPVFAFWCFMFWINSKEYKKIIYFIFSGLLSLGLSAFFTLPAIFEQNLIHVDTLTKGYYEFIAHYATIGQLLTDRSWGYGPSIWGPKDGMPFHIGQVNWIVSLIVLVIAVARYFYLRKSKKRMKSFLNTETILVIIFTVAFGWFAAFMAHQNSTFIWQKIKPLAFVQFPWRFLTLVMLGFSIAAGSISVLLPKKLSKPISILIIAAVLITNWNYFKPQGGKMGPLTDEEKFRGAAWDLQRTAGIFDYLPKTAKMNPKDPPKTLAEIVTGSGELSDLQQGTDWASFNANLGSESIIRVNLFDFPTWDIKVNGVKASAFMPQGEVYGRMYLALLAGQNKVSLELKNTPIRTFSNFLSLIVWIVTVFYIIKISRNNKIGPAKSASRKKKLRT